jgi:hypothetical protein
MVQIVERVQAHYEVHEVPFGITYEWHPAYVALECECSQKTTLSATSTITTCPRCGADLGDAFVHDIKERHYSWVESYVERLKGKEARAEYYALLEEELISLRG